MRKEYDFSKAGQTLQDNIVTVRERDSMEQIRVSMGQLKDYLRVKLEV